MQQKNNIVIQVQPHYLEHQSLPAEHKYAFAYTIKMTNLGTEGAKLLSRHWVITDAHGLVEHVRGDGVVGKNPYLKPGEEFTYTSGALLTTSVGVMQGSYTMLSDGGDHFEAPIPQFTLSIPRTLH